MNKGAVRTGFLNWRFPMLIQIVNIMILTKKLKQKAGYSSVLFSVKAKERGMKPFLFV